MTQSSSSALAFAALLANLAFVATGCGVFGADETPPPAPFESDTPAPARDDAEPPKAAPVGGPASTNELTDAFGVFVSPKGSDTADGTHDRPLASIQAGITLANRVGKRVYVCTGTYREALVLANSNSVIGALDCTDNQWHVGAKPTRIESPTSPAVSASKIKDATRLEGLEIFAPDATAPSGSSIGLLADHAPALVIANSKIVAGNAMKGTDGAEGIQLANATTTTGAPFTNTAHCVSGTCERSFATNLWVRPPQAAGGTNTCQGAPGHVAEAGGAGGSGGLYEVKQNVSFYFDYYRSDAAYGADNGVKTRTSAPGADGTDGKTATLGTISANGYTPADGTAGTDGATGSGGAGGSGRSPYPTVDPNTSAANGVWRGYGGAGGGAGGCPGLAGSAGTGGGASIAALLVESPLELDSTELVSGRGGDPGKGTFGSSPTTGGREGPNFDPIGFAFLSAKPGGRGGAAGISGNGSSGPSVGIAHVGAKPAITGTTKVFPGAGGAAVDARTRTDALGITKAIPATPAGLAKDILAL